MLYYRKDLLLMLWLHATAAVVSVDTYTETITREKAFTAGCSYEAQFGTRRNWMSHTQSSIQTKAPDKQSIFFLVTKDL